MTGSRVLMFLIAAPFIAGCSQEPTATPGASPTPAGASASQSPDPSAEPTTTGATEVRKVPASDLPIGDFLPPLDGGRVEIPAPQGWTPLPRDSKFVARFFKDDKNGLPRIEVLVDEKPLGVDNVTPETLTQFVAAVTESLGNKKLIEPVLPMILGENAWARYVIKLELKMPQGSVVAERQTLVTVRNGRTYTVQLLVLPNKLLGDRDAGYAVGAGMKFHAVEAPATGS